MKISIKRNIFFCLFVTTFVVLAVYQYCDTNKNRCYPYPLDTHEPIYQLTNQSFLTLKEMTTSAHVKWIPKEIYKQKNNDGDMKALIKFTSHLNAGNDMKPPVLLTPSPSATATDDEAEISRYKKEQTLQIRNDEKEELSTISKNEKALRRFERVDRLIDDHDDEDEDTIEKLRTMKSNDHSHNKSSVSAIPTKGNHGEIRISTVKFHPISSKSGSNVNENSSTDINRGLPNLKPNISTVSEVSKNPTAIKKKEITYPFATVRRPNEDALQPSTKVASEAKRPTIPRTLESRPTIKDSNIMQENYSTQKLDSDDLATLREVFSNSPENKTKQSTLMRDIIQGNVHKILSNISKSPNSSILLKKTSKSLRNLSMASDSLIEGNLLGTTGSASSQTDDDVVEADTRAVTDRKIYRAVGKVGQDPGGLFRKSEYEDDLVKQAIINGSGDGSGHDAQPHSYMPKSVTLSNSSTPEWNERHSFPSIIDSALGTLHKGSIPNASRTTLSETKSVDDSLRSLMHTQTTKSVQAQTTKKQSEGEGKEITLTAGKTPKEDDDKDSGDDDKDSGDDESSGDDDGRVSSFHNNIYQYLPLPSSNRQTPSQNSQGIRPISTSHKPKTTVRTNTATKIFHNQSINTISSTINHAKVNKGTEKVVSSLQSKLPLSRQKSDSVSGITKVSRRQQFKNAPRIKKPSIKRKLSKDHGFRQASKKKYRTGRRGEKGSRVTQKGPLFFASMSCQPIYPSMILYNRIFKTGSSSLDDFLSRVSKRMKFTAYKGETEDWYDIGDPTPYPVVIETLAKNKKGRKTFTAHFYFRKNLTVPGSYTYVNQLREPVRRLVSHYFYMRSNDRPKKRILEMKNSGEWNETLEECFEKQHKGCQSNLMTRFFCGTEDFCKTGSDKALSQAMYNMKHYYAAVGILEYINVYLRILKRRLPKFFPRVSPSLKALKANTDRKYISKVSPRTLQRIRSANAADVKLYKFAKILFWKEVKACHLKRRKRYHR